MSETTETTGTVDASAAVADGTDGVTYRLHRDGDPRPYSATAAIGGMVWTCGQVPVASDGTMPETAAGQIEQIFANLDEVLEDAGSSRDRILKITMYIQDLGDLDELNAAYLRQFEGLSLPPRTTVLVAGFRTPRLVEVEAVAAVR